MREVVVAGVGMHPFGRFMDKSLGDMARVAIWNAIKDSGVPAKKIEAAYVGNSLEGLMSGQEGVRGEVVMRDAGFAGLAITNVENACASGSTAFRGAWLEVGAGIRDVALAVGVEKLFCSDTARSIKALAADSELNLGRLGYQFPAQYAMWLKGYMRQTGATQNDLAEVMVKNSYHASLNPYAQYRIPLTLEQVLGSRLIAYPLTLYMCSTFADGAAAAVLCSLDVARKFARRPFIRVKACALRSGFFWHSADTGPDLVEVTANEAYEYAGIGPESVNLAEVHAAMGPAELQRYEELRLCGKGEGVKMLHEKRTWITGDVPVNTSGGLCGRGHPVGATGLAQVAEIVWQLRGEAGARQIRESKVGVVQNSGGHVGDDSAASTCTILAK